MGKNHSNYSFLVPISRKTPLEIHRARCRKDIEMQGFISNSYLADASKIPKQESLAIHFDNRKLQFAHLQRTYENLYFFIGQKRVDVFSKHLPGMEEMIYKDRKMIEIESPQTGKDYDLNTYASFSGKDVFTGRGSMYFANSVTTPDHFVPILGSMINVILLKDGFIRIDLTNCECKTMAFRVSKSYENAIDIFIDSEMEPGDVYLTEIVSGMTIFNPVLASALKHQAIIGPIDENEGLYYACCSFCYYGDGVFTYIDNCLDVGSSLKYNKELFSDAD